MCPRKTKARRFGIAAKPRSASSPHSVAVIVRPTIGRTCCSSSSRCSSSRLLLGEATDPDGPHAPSLIVLDEDWQVESMTPGAETLLAELPGGDVSAARSAMPVCVLSVAGRALRSLETAESTGEVAVARVRSNSGRWMIVHRAPLLRDGSRRVAIIVERGDPDRLAPLLMAAYELTEREKDVTRLVLQGETTSSIAARLFVSPQTVQQHLKSIFDKTGVRSRRELVSNLFFAHYEPRVRDNERRAQTGRPFRGGPVVLGRGDGSASRRATGGQPGDTNKRS
jgi:DNA-binding CsgD family transcriptional regulator